MSGEQAGAAVAVLAEPEFDDDRGRVRDLLLGTWRGRFGIAVLGLFTFIAIFGSLLAPYDPTASSLAVLEPPSFDHIMGTTESGADVFSQILVGARVSMVVGFAAALISAVLGSAVGLASGYFGGWTDRILDALENWFLVIPTLPLMIVLARLLNPSLIVLIAVIGLTSWAGTGRIVRAQVLTLRERAFVERARALGARDIYIIKTHILPNTLPLIFANTVLIVAVAILSEAALSFLGLGVPPPLPSWGVMISEAKEYMFFSPWVIVIPGVALFVLVLGINLLGDGLRDMFGTGTDA